MKIGTILWVIWTLVLLAVLLLPGGGITPFKDFQHWDKIAHFCLFAVTGFLSIYGATFFPKFRTRCIFGLIFGLTLAIGTELGQSLIPSRTVSIFDFLADLAGLILGVLVYILLYRKVSIRSRLRL